MSIVILSKNGGDLFRRCLIEIKRQVYQGDVQLIVIDSGSTDGSVELARKMASKTIRIDPGAFHHSRTRNLAVQASDLPYVLFIVQDALPGSAHWLDDLVQTAALYGADAVHVRQVPREGATLFERFELLCHDIFMGRDLVLQKIPDPQAFKALPYDDAYRRVRLDNVCALYRKEALIRMPFPEIDFAEDMAWALICLSRGGLIVYEPEITIFHSHGRSPEYRLHRAVVNAMACAQIMGRVREDLSFLSAADLAVFTAALLVEEQKRAPLCLAITDATYKKCFLPSPVLTNAARRIPLQWRWQYLKTRWGKKTGLESLQSCLERFFSGVEHVLAEVQKNFDLRPGDELTDVRNQIMAHNLGEFFGNVYGSHWIRGSVPSGIRRWVEPYRKDV